MNNSSVWLFVSMTFLLISVGFQMYSKSEKYEDVYQQLQELQQEVQERSIDSLTNNCPRSCKIHIEGAVYEVKRVK